MPLFMFYRQKRRRKIQHEVGFLKISSPSELPTNRLTQVGYIVTFSILKFSELKHLLCLRLVKM